MAGRSPAMKARRTVQQQRNAMSPQISSAPSTAPINDSTVSPLSQANANGGAKTPTTNAAAPVRKTSFKNGRLTVGTAPPPIPDADGFVPLTSARNRNSFYDNVTPTGGSVVGSTKHSREPSTNTTGSRVHSTANNVTYVSVGDDSNPPESPTPDYDDNEAPNFETALRNQYAMTTGQYRQH